MKNKESEMEKEKNDRTWDMYVEIGQFERHFSSHQVTMRTLASTWLLASFAGIGVAISKEMQTNIPALLLAACICIVTFIGLVLLWILDLLVYQRLLDAAYLVGKDLEENNSWLPRVRIGMRDQLKGDAVFYMRLYYIVASVVMLVISAIFFFYWLIQNQKTIVYALILYAVLIYFTPKIMVKMSPTTLEQEKKKKSDKAQV